MPPQAEPSRRQRLEAADLRAAWDDQAAAFVAWAREPNHDSYWLFHRDLFLQLVPRPGRRTLDLGCGEGRLSRDLKALGHSVVGIDSSRTMVAAALDADPEIEVLLADAAALPFGDSEFDLVIAFMSLQDADDLEGAVGECERVLGTGGRLCLAIVHPLNSAGAFVGDDSDSPFMIEGSYLEPSYYADDVARGGLRVRFVSAHRPLQTYTDALTDRGFLIERLREPPVPDPALRTDRGRRWRRVPMFLHLRAVKP